MGSRLVRLLAFVGASLSLAAVASAESFGPLPGPDQSRCAQLSANRTTLNIGQTITLHAGPITAQCGGPPNRTSYAWQTTDPAQPSAATGLIQVRPCPVDSPVCIYRARLFTQPKLWQSVGIIGTSPDGGWSAGEPYAIRYGKYFGVAIGINVSTADQPNSVRMTGNGRNESITADVSGLFEFAMTRGTYTFHWRLHNRNHSHTLKLHYPPGKSVQINL